MAIAISIVALVLFTILAGWYGYLVERSEERRTRDHDAFMDRCLAMIQKKDSRIAELDADYKALVESYTRETGKVWLRPISPVTDPGRTPPPQPSAFRFKPLADLLQKAEKEQSQ